MLLPNRDTDLSHSFNNSQVLFRRADFNLFAANLRLDSSKIQSVHEQLTHMATRPRRRSTDGLTNEEGSEQISLNSSGMFKQNVVASLQKTAQLTSELQDMKLQNRYLQRQIAEQASKPAEDDSKQQKQLVTFESKANQLPMSIEELNHRLIQILKKLLNPNESADRFAKSKQAQGDVMKEILFEISCKIDEMIIQIRQLEEGRQRASSQESAEQVNYLSAIRTSSPGAASTHIGLAPP